MMRDEEENNEEELEELDEVVYRYLLEQHPTAGHGYDFFYEDGKQRSRYAEELIKAKGKGAYRFAEMKYREAKNNGWTTSIEMWKKIMDELKKGNRKK